MWCLLEKSVSQMRDAIKRGDITFSKLKKLSSDGRIETFSKYMGEADAKRTNLLFEKRLLQKDRLKGYESWISQVTGVDSSRIKTMKKLLQRRSEEATKKLFNPKDEKAFLKTLASQKVGVDLTFEEAKTLNKLSVAIEKSKDIFNRKTILSTIEGIRDISLADKKNIDSLILKLKTSKEERKLTSNTMRRLRKYLEGEKPSDEVKATVDKLVEDISLGKITGNNKAYGIAKITLDDYIGQLKLGVKPKKSLGDMLIEGAGVFKAVSASLDVSFIGRQGLITLITNPKTWLKGVGTGLKTFGKELAGRNDIDPLVAVRHEIAGRANSVNGIYDKMKVAVGVTEEAFPSTLPERIPFLGKAFSASSKSFTASMYRMRADLADMYIDKALKNGVDIFGDNNYALGLGRMINSMTGRGDIGLGKLGKTWNALLFSPKYLQSRLDFLTAHAFDKEIPLEVKKIAGKNLLKVVATIGGTLALFEQFMPGSVEKDPRSSEFGKVKVGNTTFDLTGGNAGIITLLSRLPLGMKDSSTGEIRGGLFGDTKFGDGDAIDILATFVENKTSPLAGAFIDVLKKENFSKEEIRFDKDPVNAVSVLAKGLFVPIIGQTIFTGFKERETEPYMLAVLADAVGIGSSMYKFTDRWEKKTSEEMKQFQEKVGKEKFEEANMEFNRSVGKKLISLKKDASFVSLGVEDKKKIIDAIKKDEKQKIFDKFSFKENTKKTQEERLAEKQHEKERKAILEKYK